MEEMYKENKLQKERINYLNEFKICCQKYVMLWKMQECMQLI